MRDSQTAEHIAYFVTPHGFGHAARAAAIMESLQTRRPDLHFELFTRTPAWFFEDTLGSAFSYHSCLTDIGMVQKSALEEDLPATLQQLDDFLPFDPAMLDDLAARLLDLGCRLAVCDISPLGIAVAQRAGLPVVLVENFTWDWIYQGYAQLDGREKAWSPHIEYLARLFDSVDYLIQTQPFGQARAAQLVTAPVSREPRTPPDRVRHLLAVDRDARLVLVTMGGVPWHDLIRRQLADLPPDLVFLVPGGQGNIQDAGLPANVRFLGRNSGFYHPDLVNACHAVVGKAGYSTVAETYWSGLPFGYVIRPRFRESACLEAFIQQEIPSLPVSDACFLDGSWTQVLPELLSMSRQTRQGQNGSLQVATFILELLA
jgi:UDP:flavonoid glycosyltransferase YjiC (YdhE family)